MYSKVRTLPQIVYLIKPQFLKSSYWKTDYKIKNTKMKTILQLKKLYAVISFVRQDLQTNL